MKMGFYCRLAGNNMKRNRALYLPNLLAGMGLAMVFFIVLTLSMDNRLNEVKGGRYLSSIMPYGVVVIAILSLILLLYINSFLMKQRKREFGLYNVLGMEKRHISRILFWETGISCILVVLGGLAAGVLCYKLCALFICRLLGVDSVLGFYHISPKNTIPTALFFTGIYLLNFFYNQLSILRLHPTQLLQSTQAGEKEPGVKWLLLIIGLGTLIAGYYISLVTKQPLQAISKFFLAVILVVIGTYCLFITGSTAALKGLKKWSAFYYQKHHMIAVSGLLYRMKQNAVGLASITILATMVLVMVSTTVSMYAGIGDTIKRQYSHQLTLSAFYYRTPEGTEEKETVVIPVEELLQVVSAAAEEQGFTISDTENQRYLAFAVCQEEDGFLLDRSQVNAIEGIMECFFMTAEDYQALTGQTVELEEGEVAVYGLSGNTGKIPEVFTLGGQRYICGITLEEFPISMSEYQIVDCYGIVVKDEETFQSIYELQKEAYGLNASNISDALVLDFSEEGKVAENYDAFYESLRSNMHEYVNAQQGATGGYGMTVDSKWDALEYLYGMYGTLLFLGLILSLVFLFATALIIYYKQISEGYEDRQRFHILEKVGMSPTEIKGAIRSQILLVFFLPLVVAAMHTAFAFPILTRLLRILFQSDQILFLKCLIGSLGAFAALYVLIYSLTARTYYEIVRK
jgi:putative ABC transport system permease protein